MMMMMADGDVSGDQLQPGKILPQSLPKDTWHELSLSLPEKILTGLLLTSFLSDF